MPAFKLPHLVQFIRQSVSRNLAAKAILKFTTEFEGLKKNNQPIIASKHDRCHLRQDYRCFLERRMVYIVNFFVHLLRITLKKAGTQ